MSSISRVVSGLVVPGVNGFTGMRFAIPVPVRREGRRGARRAPVALQGWRKGFHRDEELPACRDRRRFLGSGRHETMDRKDRRGRPQFVQGPAWACLLLLAAAVGMAHADTALLLPSKDATLIEHPSGAFANGSGPALFAGRINSSFGSIRRGLIAFDIAAALPPGSVVTGATLRLSLTSTSAGPVPVRLHRLLADWGEGASAASGGGGAPSVPGDATWIHRFYDVELWATPGGDFDPAARAEAIVDQPGPYAWGPTVAMVADVPDWLDHPEANRGWLLAGDEGLPQTVKRFESRESDQESLRPILEVEFVPPCRHDPAGYGEWKRLCGTSEGISAATLACAASALSELGLAAGDACAAVLSEPPWSCDDLALRKVAVLVLNLCSGRLQTSCPVAAGDGECVSATVGDLLREISDLL